MFSFARLLKKKIKKRFAWEKEHETLTLRKKGPGPEKKDEKIFFF